MYNTHACAFCQRADSKLTLVSSEFKDDVLICTSCAIACSKFHDSEKNNKEEKKQVINSVKLPSPNKIKEYLDNYIIGQDEAKISLAIGVYQHYKKLKHKYSSNSEETKDDIELEKTNIMLLGPTGTGKTKLVKLLANMLRVPFSITDATTITESGYSGNDVESILLPLTTCKYNQDRSTAVAELGIVYIDEIDKLRKTSDNLSISRDVSGQGVQHSLLKVLEGTNASLPSEDGRKHPEDSQNTIDTTDILFIVGGAFDGVEKIAEKRVNTNTIGFLNEGNNSNVKDIWEKISTQDIIKFGMMKEFVGRFSNVATLHKLTRESLKRIAIEPKDSVIKQFQTLFKIDGIDLEFTEEAISEIAKKAEESEIGARGIKVIVENILKNVMFNMYSTKVTKVIVDKDCVINSSSPKIIIDSSPISQHQLSEIAL